MTIKWTKATLLSKLKTKTVLVSTSMLLVIGVAACTTNQATGDRQFTGLLPVEKEKQVGAQEHQKVEAQFGKFMTGPIADYVSRVGQKVAANTERKDIQYRFYTIDSPIVNAFALPGGYIYISRGLLTLANSEAELAAVLGHEIGHVTGRHAAERMGQSALAGIGAAVVGIASGNAAVGRATSLGANLYVASYSRGQELESDELGVRYLSRSGYDPMAMSDFLRSLDAQSKLEGGDKGFSYFSTHPITGQRVTAAAAEARKFTANNNEERAAYLQKINGLTYGDSSNQGFVKDNKFFHPEIGFKFNVPEGSKVNNGAQQVVMTHPNGSVIVFDMARDKANPSAYQILTQNILKGKNATDAERVTVNGMNAATASFQGSLQGKSTTIRVVVYEWAPGQYFRFQMAMSPSANQAFVNELKRMTYSFARMSSSEKNAVKPKTLRVLAAPAGATVASMAAKMDVEGDKTKHFLVLNALPSNATIRAGAPYKIVVD